jgi:hypothetical protein
MRQLSRLSALGLISVFLTGCFAGPAATATSNPAVTLPPASVPESVAPSADPAASDDPVPSDALGEFTCDLPIVDGTPERAVYVDVRVGTHAGYDRVVFEFSNGLPEMSLERATPPFMHDTSGMPVEVEGTSFLRLTMPGGTKETEEHTSAYDGPIDFHPEFPMLVHLIEGGDFEAHSTWYLGLTGDACARVTLLTDDGPPRLVIDVEH